MKNSGIKKMVFTALFAAATAVLAQLAVPLPGLVPVTLTHISIFLAAGLLGPRLAALSLSVYAALGAAGAPVFSSFGGGMAKILGPTGGFIVGYIFCAFISGLIIEKRGRGIFNLCAAMTAGALTLYILGTAWYMFSMKAGVFTALWACVVPFIPGDILKIAVCALLIPRLCKVKGLTFMEG